MRRCRPVICGSNSRRSACRGWRGLPGRTALSSRLRAYEICRPLVEGRRGIEIGGPSAIFARNGALPLYPLFDQLDNCDFARRHDLARRRGRGRRVHLRRASGRPVDGSSETQRPWTGSTTRRTTSCSRRTRSSTSRTRCARSSEWRRIVGSEGHLVLVLPHLQNTFDHRRPVTALEHIEADFARLDRRGRPDACRGVHRALRPEARPRSAVAPGLRAANARLTSRIAPPPPRLRHRSRRQAARSRGLSAPLGRDGASVSHRRRCPSERT